MTYDQFDQDLQAPREYLQGFNDTEMLLTLSLALKYRHIHQSCTSCGASTLEIHKVGSVPCMAQLFPLPPQDIAGNIARDQFKLQANLLHGVVERLQLFVNPNIAKLANFDKSLIKQNGFYSFSQLIRGGHTTTSLQSFGPSLQSF
ncbi:hypothetical protein DM01DRAFT_1344988 [Hesseltinella vesiculosa]|uniref:Uncharacterized protein n=1 Tax=Hesseltinella vesiculosa TaxID=101127 RepID=A0A1X2GL47_9FUNG|nr:hypothetical protein DM01DRAFT_1344988 [Hesseltinella vesiculosa]